MSRYRAGSALMTAGDDAERSDEKERRSSTADRSEELDPGDGKHGGFSGYEIAMPGPGFARFLTAVRRLQDLAVSTDPDDDTWGQVARRAEELVTLLDPFQVPEGIAPAGRAPTIPGMGSLLLPPWRIRKFGSDGVAMTGEFSRFHMGGRLAVHGGVLSLLFDWACGMVVHASGRPISRTAFLHVDYRKVTPIDTPLRVRGRVDSTVGRKAFVSAELTTTDGTVLAEANALMVGLLPGQP